MAWQKLDPSWLSPETVVGLWKLKAFHGGGAFGAVFRAARVRREHGGPVAVKVALQPGDPRFQREVELLSRLHHLNVPELLGSGEWQGPGGETYPYLVMEWVEGLPLYAWAERVNPSSREVCRVMSQLARALDATHAVEGVHRDVKGDNLLVNPQGGRAFLTDFGAGHYAGAARLTREGLPPGTDAYRSPEAWEFVLRLPRNSTDVYAVQPADDVFALGVSAYRLVTGKYLPPLEVSGEEEGLVRLEWAAPRAPRELNPRVEQGLSELILRALSVKPEERPSAGELADALDKAARNPAPGAERPLFAGKEGEGRVEAAMSGQRQVWEVEEESARAGSVPMRSVGPSWMGYVACVVVGGVVAAGAVGWVMRTRWTGGADISVRLVSGVDPRDTGSAGLGDTELTAPAPWEDALPKWGHLSLPMPEEPFAGQRRAPHCRPPLEVSINGGCWIEAPTVKPPCGDLSYEWQGNCYVPHILAPRKTTSALP